MYENERNRPDLASGVLEKKLGKVSRGGRLIFTSLTTVALDSVVSPRLDLKTSRIRLHGGPLSLGVFGGDDPALEAGLEHEGVDDLAGLDGNLIRNDHTYEKSKFT